MLDLGYGPQPGLWPNVDGVGEVDALILSHAHRDHAGGLDLREKIGNPPVFASAPVARMLPAAIGAQPLPLVGETEVLGIRVRTGRNGHAPGGVWLHLDIAGGFIYMGDHSVESLIYAYDPPPAAATLVLDASYGAYDAPLAACIEQFAPELARIAREAPPITGTSGLMFTGLADATEGEAARLVAKWEGEPAPEIVFTGYLPPGTPAERLVNSGRARYLRWNVHPRLSDNAALVRAVGATTVIPAFCERGHLAALSDAFAPARVTMNTPLDLQ